jgi:Spy/CpxP family protein refolding chaperone
MTRTRMKIAQILVLAGVLAMPAAVVAQAPARVPQVNLRATTGNGGHDRHLTMRRALGELEHTRAMLRNNAAHDFHGHRRAAIHHIDGAIHELRAGLEADRD